jgi:anion-transporting  ArsA/GET3 family ATPase
LPADEMAALLAVAEEMISEQSLQIVAVDMAPSLAFLRTLV